MVALLREQLRCPVVVRRAPAFTGVPPALPGKPRSRSLGAALLGFERVGIDPERLRLELDPGPDASDPLVIPPTGPYLGLTLTDAPAACRIGSLVSGTPAARAGLRPGDRLLRLDGRDVTALDASTLNRLLWLAPDEKVTLVFSRPASGDLLEVTLP